MSDFDAMRARRLEELEAKKKRLAEMRKRKQDREAGAATAAVTTTATATVEVAVEVDTDTSSTNTKTSGREEVDDLVKSLLSNITEEKVGEDNVSKAGVQSGVPPPAPVVVSKEIPLNEAPVEIETVREKEKEVIVYDKEIQTDLAQSDIDDLSSQAEALKKLEAEKDKLSLQLEEKLNAPQAGSERSPSHTHSPNSPNSSSGSVSESPTKDRDREERQRKEIDVKSVLASADCSNFLSFLDRSSRIVERTLCAHISVHPPSSSAAQAPSPRSPHSKSKNADVSATTDPNIIARNDHVDVLTDYRQLSRSGAGIGSRANNSTSYAFSLYCPSLSGRPVMAVQSSPHSNDLLAVAYGSPGGVNSSASAFPPIGATSKSDPSNPNNTSAGSSSGLTSGNAYPGAVALWSLSLPSRPECMLWAPSPVLSCAFLPYGGEPALIVGGCYNGQVLVWDLRAEGEEQALPVRSSPLAGGIGRSNNNIQTMGSIGDMGDMGGMDRRRGHVHPVFCLEVRASMSMIQGDQLGSCSGSGLQAAFECVSAASDGSLCVWDLEDLQQPLYSATVCDDRGSEEEGEMGMAFGRAQRKAVGVGISAMSLAPHASSSTSSSVSSFSRTGTHGYSRGHSEVVIGSTAGGLFLANPVEKAQGDVGDIDSTALSITQKGLGASTVAGAGAGIIRKLLPSAAVDAHIGIVSAVSPHPRSVSNSGTANRSQESSDSYSGLLLTSSFDWSVKLWSLSSTDKTDKEKEDEDEEEEEESANANASTSANAHSDSVTTGSGSRQLRLVLDLRIPLSCDYIVDTRWSPSNPCAFAAVSSNGLLALWNLGRSASKPLESVQLPQLAQAHTLRQKEVQGQGQEKINGKEMSAAQPSALAPAPAAGALNKLAWSKDGRTLLVGDSAGTVHVLSVSDIAALDEGDEGRFELAMMDESERQAHVSRSQPNEDIENGGNSGSDSEGERGGLEGGGQELPWDD